MEPVTHPPPVIETRPPPNVDQGKIDALYPETHTALIAGKYSCLYT